MARRRMGALDLGTDLNLAILVGIGIGGYLLYKYLKPSSTPPGAQTSDTGTSLTPDQAAKDAASQSEPPNYDQTQYATWAAAIQDEGNRFFPSSGSQTLAIMDQMDNLADVESLTAAFGNFAPRDLGIPDSTYNLASWIHAAFTNAAIASFNQQLAWNGVQFSF